MQYYHSYMNAKRAQNDRGDACAFCLNRIARACAEHADARYYPHTLTYHDADRTLYIGEAPEEAAMRISEPLEKYCAARDALEAYLEVPDEKTARFYLNDADGNTLAEVFFTLFEGVPGRVVGEEPSSRPLKNLACDVFRTIDGLRKLSD